MQRMNVPQVGMHAADVRFDQVLGYVKVDWNDRKFAQQNFFSLTQYLKTFPGVGLSSRLFQQSIVFRDCSNRCCY